MAKKDKQFKTRNKVLGVFFRPLYRLVVHCAYRIRLTRIKVNGPTLFLCNHQTDLDSIIIMGCLNKHVQTVVVDSLLSNGASSRFLSWVCGLIPKKKGSVDTGCVVKMLKCLKEGGNVLLFPEGNRTYAEFQFSFNESILKIAKKTNVNVVVLNIHNGTGVNPRWGAKKRKGTITVEVKDQFTAEQVKNADDKELFEKIKEELRVFDSDSGTIYRSKAPAEYLERLFYVCPECKSLNTLSSDKDKITCSNCNASLIYQEDLRFKENKYNFNKLIDWYDFQKDVARNLEIKPGQLIFEDNIKGVYEYEIYKKRKQVADKNIKLYDDKLVFDDSIEIDISTISAASPISGTKFSMESNGKSYLIVGTERFNPLKYVHLFNRLDTLMKKENLDDYYNLK